MSMDYKYSLYNYRYYLQVSTGIIPETFYVDSIDGRIILRKSVNAGDSFNFIIEARDGGEPPLTGTTFVTVRVVRSTQPISVGKRV